MSSSFSTSPNGPGAAEALEYCKQNLAAVTVAYFGADGTEYFEVGVPGGWYAVGAGKAVPLANPTPPPKCAPVELHSIAAFARAVVDQVVIGQATEHITVSPAELVLAGPLNAHREREQLVKATMPGAGEVDGKWMEGPALAAMLRRTCGPSESRDRLIGLLNDVKVSNQTVQKGKGLSFKVAAERSLDGDGWHDVTDPVFALHPLRVFDEAFAAGDIPAAEFLLEAQQATETSVLFRLTELAGDRWQVAAAEKVRAHLETAISAAIEVRSLATGLGEPPGEAVPTLMPPIY